MYLDEIQDDLRENLGIRVHISTISRAMKRYNITHKKVFTECDLLGNNITHLQGVQLTRSAAERSEEMRDDYRIVVAGMPAESFVFIDESSIDCRTTNRDMGYSPQGERAQHETHFVRGDR